MSNLYTLAIDYKFTLFMEIAKQLIQNQLFLDNCGNLLCIKNENTAVNVAFTFHFFQRIMC